VAVVEARGSVDCDRVEPLAAELEDAVAAGVERILVDLSRTRDVTTAAVNVLLDARGRLLPRKGVIAVVLPPRLRRWFELLRLDRRFLLATSRSEAADLLGLTVAGAPAPDPVLGRSRAA
jgi:anti-anti-sigma regulatory factor